MFWVLGRDGVPQFGELFSDGYSHESPAAVGRLFQTSTDDDVLVDGELDDGQLRNVDFKSQFVVPNGTYAYNEIPEVHEHAVISGAAFTRL